MTEWTYDLSEREVRRALQQIFARAESAHISQRTQAISDMYFWQKELKLIGRQEIYQEEYRRHERAKRGIGLDSDPNVAPTFPATIVPSTTVKDDLSGDPFGMEPRIRRKIVPSTTVKDAPMRMFIWRRIVNYQLIRILHCNTIIIVIASNIFIAIDMILTYVEKNPAYKLSKNFLDESFSKYEEIDFGVTGISIEPRIWIMLDPEQS